MCYTSSSCRFWMNSPSGACSNYLSLSRYLHFLTLIFLDCLLQLDSWVVLCQICNFLLDRLQIGFLALNLIVGSHVMHFTVLDILAKSKAFWASLGILSILPKTPRFAQNAQNCHGCPDLPRMANSVSE